MNIIQTLKTSLTYAVTQVRGPLARIEREVNEHRFADVHNRRANKEYQKRSSERKATGLHMCYGRVGTYLYLDPLFSYPPSLCRMR